MVGLSLSAPEMSQVKMLPVCPTVRGVLKLAVTMTAMGGAIRIKLWLIIKIHSATYQS